MVGEGSKAVPHARLCVRVCVCVCVCVCVRVYPHSSAAAGRGGGGGGHGTEEARWNRERAELATSCIVNCLLHLRRVSLLDSDSRADVGHMGEGKGARAGLEGGGWCAGWGQKRVPMVTQVVYEAWLLVSADGGIGSAAAPTVTNLLVILGRSSFRPLPAPLLPAPSRLP